MDAKILQGVLVVLKDLLVEDVVDVGGEVWSEMPGDEDTALLVEDVDGRNATHSNDLVLNYKILSPGPSLLPQLLQIKSHLVHHFLFFFMICILVNKFTWTGFPS